MQIRLISQGNAERILSALLTGFNKKERKFCFLEHAAIMKPKLIRKLFHILVFCIVLHLRVCVLLERKKKL